MWWILGILVVVLLIGFFAWRQRGGSGTRDLDRTVNEASMRNRNMNGMGGGGGFGGPSN